MDDYDLSRIGFSWTPDVVAEARPIKEDFLQLTNACNELYRLF